MSKSIDNLRDKLDAVIPILSENNITNFMLSEDHEFYLEKYGIANSVEDSEVLSAGNGNKRWIPLPTLLCPKPLSVPGRPDKC